MTGATFSPMFARSSALAIAVAALATAPAAHAKQCNVQRDAENFGVSYVTSLEVKGVSCATGKKVVRAYHKCRKANGGIKGRCSRVLGYSCTERRESIKTQFSAKANCRSGTRRVIHTYTQFT